jgi:hypothetical protein
MLLQLPQQDLKLRRTLPLPLPMQPMHLQMLQRLLQNRPKSLRKQLLQLPRLRKKVLKLLRLLLRV